MKATENITIRGRTSVDDEERLHLFGELTTHLSKRPRGNSLTFKRVYIVILHTMIFLLALLAWTRATPLTTSTTLIQGRTWSPVHEFMQYEINGDHATNHAQYSEYSGPPSETQEQAWEELIRPAYFNASLDEFQKANETVQNAAELVQGGFLAAIGVYHELHCLRQLRFYLYKDRYYPNITEDEERYIHGHLDHCLESLRMTIMCHGNPSVYSFAWDRPNTTKPATKSNSRSVCVKWSSIESWGLARMVSTNPKLRPPVGG